MTNNIARIRAALELLEWRVLEAERKNQPIVATRRQLDEALAALAELEKAAPQFVAGEVTAEMSSRVANSYFGVDTPANMSDMLEVLRYWQRELGPALGLVELKEPTPEECRDIWREAKANEGDGSKVCAGRAMFDACRAVLWPKEGL